MTKQELYNEGINYLKTFCKVNNIKFPKITVYNTGGPSGRCGEYDFETKEIDIYLKSCAKEVMTPGWSWSHRHYFADREPCGVLCHEFGHYLHDILTNANLTLPRERKITSYEPNKWERFAETIKLFILNPDLLKNYDPKRYDILVSKLHLKPIINKPWEILMRESGMSEKFINAAKKKIGS